VNAATGPLDLLVGEAVHSPSQRLAVQTKTGRHQHLVKLFDLVSGKEQWTANLGDRLQGHPLWYHPAFSPDGKRLAVFHDAVVHVLDALTGKELLTLRGHRSHHGAEGTSGPRGQRLAFSPDGQRLASLWGGGLKLWDMNTGQEVLDLPFDGDGLAFSPNGHYLLGFTQQGGVKRWEATPP
jgi:hypothetical protein